MVYQLRRRIIGSPGYLEIDEKMHNELVEAKALLLNALFVEEKFGVIVDNYLDLELALISSTLRHSVLGELSYDWLQFQRTNFDRLLINLLSSCRAYVDGTKHILSDVWGKESNQFAAFEEVLCNSYDEYLGYRLMEAIRNYVQHRGNVISSLRYPGGLDENRELIRFGVSIYASADELGKDSKMKAALLEELRDVGDKIELKPFIRDYVSCFSMAQTYIRESLESKVEDAERKIEKGITHYLTACPDEESHVGLATCEMETDTVVRESTSIFDDFIQLRRNYEKKYPEMTNLGKRYVSSH